jgi:2,3-bisphosphoglycerate-dependent phosphoglycerate mutase
MKIILLRHGESQWNLENRFTGWTDVDLTKKGIKEAESAAEKLIENNIQINTLSTSLLKRAINTSIIVSKIISFPKNEIQYNWRLNERHYGSLQGLNKSETAEKYGEEKVKIWRRSFDIPPPKVKNNDERHPKYSKLFKKIDSKYLPSGESLKDVIFRLKPFWENYISNIDRECNHLIVAHSNSLRAVIKIIEGINNTDIVNVNIPTGEPLVYDLTKNLNIISKSYLIQKEELIKKQKLIEQQGKVK